MILQLAMTNPALAQLILQQQQQQPQQIFPQLPYFQALAQHPIPLQQLPVNTAPVAPPIPIPVPAPVPSHASAPPSPKAFRIPRIITCHDFCERYEVNDADEEKLNILDFDPGELGIVKLSREDWQGQGKFSKLGWDRFLKKHKVFVADVLAGAWDLPPAGTSNA